MFRVVSMVGVLASLGVLVLGLRWALADVFLDRFAWRVDRWKAGTPRPANRGSTREEIVHPDAQPVPGYGESPEQDFFA
jgi:hypothetical protein